MRYVLKWMVGVVLCVLAVPVVPLSAQESSEPVPVTTELLSGLSMRSIGPALMSGRIADMAIDPVKPNTWYVAAGSGNLWKTENAGTTWTPIFDNYSSYSIGCVTIDPQDRHTIWVGTGENVSGRHVGYGDGVYVSHDGGRVFQNVGLQGDRTHLQDPGRPAQIRRRVYVAAQGPLWSSGGERGLYKTDRRWRDVDGDPDQGPVDGRDRHGVRPTQPERPVRRHASAASHRVGCDRRWPGVGHLQVDRWRSELARADQRLAAAKTRARWASPFRRSSRTSSTPRSNWPAAPAASGVRPMPARAGRR